MPRALALSRAAGWNQTPADWALVIEMNPEGCFGLECDGQLAATTSTIRYGTNLAWVGMVLTHPEYRGRGFARTLMERALDHLSDVRTVKLDATEMGGPLYKKLGFVDECATERWIRPAGAPCEMDLVSGNVPPARMLTHGGSIEPRPSGSGQTGKLRFRDDSDSFLDEVAFGADRGALLHRLAQFEGSSAEHAFALGRADRFGPCVSRSREAAEQLALWFLARHPNEELLWDLFPENNLAASLGFTLSRRLTRMTRGHTLTGDNSLIYAGAGFEFG